MKFAIFGILAFVLGLGGTTGVMVLTTPVRLTAADSLAVASARRERDAARAADSLAAAADAPANAGDATPATEHATSEPAAPAPAPAGDAHATSAVETRAASTDGATGPVVKPVAPPAAVTASEPLPELPDAESFKQVGSILLNMKPAEAAKIVGYLNDDQVEGLLRSMTPRQAASVLGQISPERAADLSRRLLLPKEKEARP
jgi:hypothetical protein